MKALGIGQPAPTPPAMALVENDNNGNTSFTLKNSTAGVNAQSTYYLGNDAGHYGGVALTSSTFTASGGLIPGDSFDLLTSAANGIVINSGTSAPIRFDVGSANVFNVMGTGVTIPAGNTYQVGGAQIDTTALSDTAANIPFIPTIAFGGASTGITYSRNTGHYTKVGKIVVFTFNINLSSKGTATGAASITLPLATGTEPSQTSPMLGFSNISSGSAIWFLIAGNGQTVAAIDANTTGGTVQCLDTNFTATTVIEGNFIYQAQ
jgi:hypothetical protein